MRVESAKCDRCGKLKGEANKWWVIVLRGLPSDKLIEIYTFEYANDEERLGSGRCLDLCGQQCVVETITDVMDGTPLPVTALSERKAEA